MTAAGQPMTALGSINLGSAQSSRSYMASDDPEFEEKAADMIGLYIKPPANAAVFYVDEKSAIQALDRLDPVLPLSPGRAERHGFGYFRHGTLSLYAALDTRTGDVIGKTTDRHTSVEFVDFLSTIVASQPAGIPVYSAVLDEIEHSSRLRRLLLSHYPGNEGRK